MLRYLAIGLTLAVPATLLPAAGAGGQDALEPANLSMVNTKGDEVDPFPLADGTTLLYASNAEGRFALLSSRRTPGEPWSAGKPLPDVNTRDYDQRSPFVTRDGRLYFATNKVPDKQFENLKNFDIFERSGELAPQPLLQVSTAQDELFPWITPSGREFYFSRKTKEGWRLFASKWPALGGIGEGKLVEEFPAGFHHATLTPDGLTMYLQGPLEQERWGLFRSTRAKVGGAWARPEALTTLNNAEGPRGDMCPCLNATGTFLYFASDRPGGQGGLDLWVIPTAQLPKKK